MVTGVAVAASGVHVAAEAEEDGQQLMEVHD